jgi:hypothetical protein
MTLPLQATVKKWALRSAGLLFALAIGLFFAFVIISSREQAEAARFGEPYDSIGSSYRWFVVVASFAVIGATVAIAVYCMIAFSSRFNRRHQ